MVRFLRKIPGSRVFFLMILLIGGVFSACTTPPLNSVRDAHPSTTLTPTEVVNIQLTALANNNRNDDGIKIAYRFASPSVRATIGQLAGFAALFEGPTFAPMLNPLEVELLDFAQRRSIAFQGVRIKRLVGGDMYYVFVLERQTGGEFKNCWMTAAVQIYAADSEQEKYAQETI